MSHLPQLPLPPVAGTIAAGLIMSGWTAPLHTDVIATTDISDIPFCNQLTAASIPNKGYTFTATASGDAGSITGYTFSFGDQQTYTVVFNGTSLRGRSQAIINHNYRQDGIYTVTARADSGGTEKAAGTPSSSSSGCQITVTVGPAATTLPLTGETYAPVVFLGATLAGMLAYGLRLQHRLADRRK